MCSTSSRLISALRRFVEGQRRAQARSIFDDIDD
jgi:hypothetical protein